MNAQETMYTPGLYFFLKVLTALHAKEKLSSMKMNNNYYLQEVVDDAEDEEEEEEEEEDDDEGDLSKEDILKVFI